MHSFIVTYSIRKQVNTCIDNVSYEMYHHVYFTYILIYFIIYLFIYLFICLFIYLRLHMYTYIYIYIYVYIDTNIHEYILMLVHIPIWNTLNKDKEARERWPTGYFLHL